MTLLSSFISPTITRNSCISRVVTKAINPINGADLGVPLNVIQNIFTNLHYGMDITVFKSVLLQFLIGYYTYGKDRFKDALEFNEKPFQTKKEELYNHLIKNQELYNFSYNLVFLIISFILVNDEKNIYNLPFIIVLYSTEYYKDLKLNFPILKPFYVSILWTLSSVILPSVLYEHNYSILKYPLDYLPSTLTLFATSNILDLKDIEEDKVNGVNTFPIKFGYNFTYNVILISLLLSSVIFGLNQHYLDRPIVNSLFEIQNSILSVIPLIISNNTSVN